MSVATAKLPLSLAIALAVCAPQRGLAESACGRALRESFDAAGQIAASPTEPQLAAMAEQLRARPNRCEPGDYARFAKRFADLLIVIGRAGFTDPRRQLAATVRVLAPQRVSSGDYEAAFRAFLEARARLRLELTPPQAAEAMAIFDATRPVEILPSVALGRDRDGVVQGLAEIRRQLALGRVSNADALAAELLRTLESEANAPDAGAPDGG